MSDHLSGRILALSVSERKGIPKSNVESVNLIENWGIEGDAHAGNGHRQVSLLATESIDKMRAKGLTVEAGAFAENITTQAVDLSLFTIGMKISIGESILEITQIGKECHSRCAIFEQIGDCVMPREGIFAIVLKGGILHVGDPITRIAD